MMKLSSLEKSLSFSLNKMERVTIVQLIAGAKCRGQRIYSKQ